MPRREKVHDNELFDKPRAEPNLFELCRGEKKWCQGINESFVPVFFSVDLPVEE